MNKFSSLFKPLTWFMALLLAAFVAGCGGDDDDSAPPAAANPAGGVCTAGAACVPLATAGSFVILTATTITDAATTSPILGNVGTSGTGAAIDLTCAEVTGTIYDDDAAYTGGVASTDVTCRTTDAVLSDKVADAIAAYTDAANDTAHPGVVPNPTANVIDSTLAPGVYSWTGDVAIPANVTLTAGSGGSNAVWIFRINGNLAQTAGTTVTLTGGALARNIFWRVTGNTALGAGAHFEGIILSPNVIALEANASVTGRLFSGGGGGAVTLITNTVNRPN